MTTSLLRILSGCFVFATASTCSASEWRGIVPLHSTRAEVIKVLGSPRHLLSDNSEFFDVENATVTFVWTDPTCEKNPIKPDTPIASNYLVFWIGLQFKQSMPMTEFALANKTLYFSSCFGSGNHRSCNFISVPDMDIGYSTWQNRVTSVSYQPGENGFKTWKANHPACFQTDSH